MPSLIKVKQKGETMMSKINIGSKVTVVDIGKTYATYETWIATPNASKYMSHWKYGDHPSKTSKYTVVAKGKHESTFYDDTLYLIQDNQSKQVYIIGEQGIKEEKTMEFKAGDKVEVIDNTGDKRLFVGDLCTVDDLRNGLLYITRDSDGYQSYMYLHRFKAIVSSQLAIGTKVKCFDGSWSYGIVDGKVSYESGDINNGIHEITAVNMVLPTKPGAIGVNDTILRRINDGKVFFVQQRFLNKYIPEPKFKQGQFVEYGDEFYRIVKVCPELVYEITGSHYNYEAGEGFEVSEDELKEVL